MGIDSVEGNFMLRETMIIHFRDDLGAASEAPQLEEANVGVLLCPEGEKVVKRIFGDDYMPTRQEEAS